MARRYGHSHRWLRLVLSPQGPPSTTRLVLSAHFLFMDVDGSNCRVGARRLAIATGLDKSTVAEHRARAIESGWLIASKMSKYSPKPEYCTAVPDSIVLEDENELSCVGGQLLSGDDGQFTARSMNQLSGLTPSTVRVEPSNCSAPPDIPLIPLLPLQNIQSQREVFGSNAMLNTASKRDQLIRWLLTDDRAQQDRHNVNVLIRLAPLRYRFVGYETIIAEIVSSQGAV